MRNCSCRAAEVEFSLSAFNNTGGNFINVAWFRFWRNRYFSSLPICLTFLLSPLNSNSFHLSVNFCKLYLVMNKLSTNHTQRTKQFKFCHHLSLVAGLVSVSYPNRFYSSNLPFLLKGIKKDSRDFVLSRSGSKSSAALARRFPFAPNSCHPSV